MIYYDSGNVQNLFDGFYVAISNYKKYQPPFIIYFSEIKKRNSGHKQHFCIFCGIHEYKLPRHFERNHKEEKDVKEALSHAPKSKARKMIWSRLARKGDYEVNLCAIKEQTEHIATVRDARASMDDYVPCPHCFGFFSSKYLFRHAPKCFMKCSETVTTKYLPTSRALLTAEVTDGKFQDVHNLLLSKMNRDELHLLIRNDDTLLLYAAVQMQKKEKDRFHDIRYSLRCLARLLIELRKEPSNSNARSRDLVLPENFDKVVQAAKSLSGYVAPRNIKTPTTFLKCGFSSRNLALVLRAVALRESSNDLLSKIRNFLELYETDWQIFATNARDCHEAKNANVPEELPMENDVKLTVQAVYRNGNR